MKMLLFVAAVGLTATVAPAFGQHAGHGMAPTPVAAAAAEAADAEVRRLDTARNTVLLKHGEIRNLNMGAMTMTFRFKDPKMAEGLKAGDKVKFTAEQKGEDLIITSIRKAP